jgi:hypothetical protein
MMYYTNSERNKIIYDLWEKDLTVAKISYSTGIPRSTVGYYVRKFNRLSAKGQPIIFPGLSTGAEKQNSLSAESVEMSLLRLKILALMEEGNWEELHFRLSIFKLMKDLGFLTEKNRRNLLYSLTK